MRFFSNDAKETNEDESATVPQQRAGSPWSDAPADNPEAADRGDDPEGVHRADDLAPQIHTDTDTAVDGDREQEHDAHDLGGPKPADDQVDLPLDEHDTFDRPDVNESTVTSPDEPVNEPTEAEATGADNDPVLRDEGDFDEPTAVDPATEEPLDTDTETETETEAKADTETEPVADTEYTGAHETTDTDTPAEATPAESDSDSTTYASAAAADEADDHDDTVAEPIAEDPTPADTSDTAPVVAAVPVAAAVAVPETDTETQSEPAKPGSVSAPTVESIFDADAAKGFQERWRDVQLRFVDSPKDATAEAAGLVDEAVEQLTASLRGQKDGLLSDSDDTEKLRIELRGYRDILNKVLAL